MSNQPPEKVKEMTLAGRAVYLALENDVLDQTEIAERTGLSKRRIRDVANDLIDAELVQYYNNPSDQRAKIYYDPTAFDGVDAHQIYSSRQSEN